MILVLIGPPGAGKGTQAQRLCKRLGLSHLASGDILRAEQGSGSRLGARVTQYMDAGRLVPDDIMIEVILSRLPADAGGYLLDGFPRTVAQAESLDEALVRMDRRIDAVVELKVPDAVIIRRITGRRICPKCNGVYHTESHPPRQIGRCDKDGEPLIQRSDDQADVVTERLRTYHDVTEPLAAYYCERSVLRSIDGTGPVEAVFEEALSAVTQIASAKEDSG